MGLRGVSWLLAAALLVGCGDEPCRIPSGTIVNASSDTWPGGSLTLLTFDLLSGGPFPGHLGDSVTADRTVEERLEMLAAELTRRVPDVVVVQEVSTTPEDRHCNTLRTLLDSVNERLAPRGIAYDAAYARAQWLPTGLGRHWEDGEAILSRFQIVSAEALPFRRQGAWGLERRVALRVSLRRAHGEIDVVGARLHRGGGAVTEAQLDQLLFEIGAAREDGRPVIVAGDLELDPDTPAIRRALHEGWVDAWGDRGSGDGATCCQGDLRDPAPAHTRRLDYVLVRGARVTQSALVLDRAVRTRGAAGQAVWLWPSNHRGLIATLVPDTGNGRTGEDSDPAWPDAGETGRPPPPAPDGDFP